ncbi:hypothetical protein [Richelia sinica]|uniref:hypothetical protein n=1 Tax=Richelia sinica TaxID=1357545 RepID=UPI001682D22A|nr:hypothetical protein [Richelia sinica]MBD2663396.1 hypothetical protein [Richelia sinica FACHB-800]
MCLASTTLINAQKIANCLDQFRASIKLINVGAICSTDAHILIDISVEPKTIACNLDGRKSGYQPVSDF